MTWGAHSTLIGFGPGGWGGMLARAALMTLSVALTAFVIGLSFGAIGAAAKLSSRQAARAAADLYTTVMRGVPDLLVIYLVFFGGSEVLASISHALGWGGIFGLNGFIAGALAVGIVSGAYQAEVIRGAILAVPRGELEAARALGLPRKAMLCRILVPRVLRFALPGLGNVWQLTLKESSLISVIGLVEILRATTLAAGATRLPFLFFGTAVALFLLLTTFSGGVFRRAERWAARGERVA